MRRILSRTGAVAAYLGLTATALGTAGIDTSALVAGISVGGITIGFAARDIASNYIAGLMLVASKPFRSGDHVVIGREGDGFMGVVTQIDLRYVHIKPLSPDDPSELLVPNSTVFSSVIRIVSSQPDTFVALDDGDHQGQEMDQLLGRNSLHSSYCESVQQEQQQGITPADTLQSELTQTTEYVELEPRTPEFVALVNISSRELSALTETQLRKKYADLLQEIPDPLCQKVVLWLASDNTLGNTERNEWVAFISKHNGRCPSWVPQALRGNTISTFD